MNSFPVQSLPGGIFISINYGIKRNHAWEDYMVKRDGMQMGSKSGGDMVNVGVYEVSFLILSRSNILV